MKAVRRHTNCKWVLLYIGRWLKAPIQKADKSLVKKEIGTPQGAVISPLLANLFLHYCMDEWLRIKFPSCKFERYADDCVIHCSSEQQTKQVKEALKERLTACGLEMHPEKTKIVYCKDEDRCGMYPQTSFDFLGFTFRRRKSRNKRGKHFTGFLPAISNKAKMAIRSKVRGWRMSSRSGSKIQVSVRASVFRSYGFWSFLVEIYSPSFPSLSIPAIYKTLLGFKALNKAKNT